MKNVKKDNKHQFYLQKYSCPNRRPPFGVVKYGVFGAWVAECMHFYVLFDLWVGECMHFHVLRGAWVAECLHFYVILALFA